MKKLFGFLILGFLSATSFADIAPDGWHFIVAPYVWTSGISGDITVKNYNRSFDISFGQILKHLDFAVQGDVEIGYGPVSVMANTVYLKVSKDVTQDFIHADATSQSTLIDTGLLWRLFSHVTSSHQYVSLELLGGGRYLGEGLSINFANIGTVSGGAGLMTPIIGARLKYSVNPFIHFWLEGDGGGFSVDHIQSTWNGLLAMGLTVQRHIDLAFAYRVLQINYAKSNTAMNTLFYGPLIGIVFH